MIQQAQEFPITLIAYSSCQPRSCGLDLLYSNASTKRRATRPGFVLVTGLGSRCLGLCVGAVEADTSSWCTHSRVCHDTLHVKNRCLYTGIFGTKQRVPASRHHLTGRMWGLGYIEPPSPGICAATHWSGKDETRRSTSRLTNLSAADSSEALILSANHHILSANHHSQPSANSSIRAKPEDRNDEEFFVSSSLLSSEKTSLFTQHI